MSAATAATDWIARHEPYLPLAELINPMRERETRIAAVVLLVAGMVLTYRFRDRLDVEALAALIGGYGLLAPVAFFAIRVAGAVVLVPGSIMAIAAGIAFGFLPGAAYNLLASTVGAVAAFLVARYLFSDWCHQRLDRRGLLHRIVSGVEAEGWRFVAFVRLVPLFPYNLANYAFGLTRISLKSYTLVTLVCMIPGDLAYVYIGYAAREALADNRKFWWSLLTAIAALATLAFIPRLVRRIRKIDRSTGSE